MSAGEKRATDGHARNSTERSGPRGQGIMSEGAGSTPRKGALVAGGDIREGWHTLSEARGICTADDSIGGFTWKHTGSGEEPDDGTFYCFFKAVGHTSNEDGAWRHLLREDLQLGGALLGEETSDDTSELECLPGALVAGGDLREGWFTIEEACTLCKANTGIGGFTWTGGENEHGQIYAFFKPRGHPHNDDKEWIRMVKATPPS